MKIWTLVVVTVVLIGNALALMAGGEFSNRRAPGFSLPDLNMVQYDPQDYRGKVLLIDIMTTTCAKCQKLADDLVQITGKMGGKVAVLSVVTVPDTLDKVRAFIGDHNIKWPILFDSGQVIASYLRVTPANPSVHFPHLFIVDGTGMIRADYDGTDDKSLSVESLSAEIARYSEPGKAR